MKIIFSYEYPRIVIIIYQYNAITKILKYGATIYNDKINQREHTNYEPFDRKKHINKALSRFQKNPVIISQYHWIIGLNIKERNKKIRKMLFKHGCCSS